MSERRARLRQAKRQHRVFRRSLASIKRQIARLEAKPMLTPDEIRTLARARAAIPKLEVEQAGQKAALADFKGGMDGPEALRRHGLEDEEERADEEAAEEARAARANLQAAVEERRAYLGQMIEDVARAQAKLLNLERALQDMDNEGLLLHEALERHGLSLSDFRADPSPPDEPF